MNKRSLGALIALNLVLLIALTVVSVTAPLARAQVKGTPGVYSMVAGTSSAMTNQAVLYILEQNSTKVAAFTYSDASKDLTPLDGRTVGNDLK